MLFLFRYGHFMYVFGGYDGGTILNDLHRLNVDTCVWEVVETSGERPLSLGRLRSEILALKQRV